ncbi:MAG: hypothetical protein RR490_09130 [Niameybacter sp.]
MEIIEMIKEVEDIKIFKSWLPHMEEVLEVVEIHDYKLYERIKEEVHKSVYGEVLCNETAEKLVKAMRPYSEHWTKEEVKQALSGMRLNAHENTLYYIMNMAYNDYYNMFGNDVEKYIEFTKLWVDDVDSSSADVKTYRYATMM